MMVPSAGFCFNVPSAILLAVTAMLAPVSGQLRKTGNVTMFVDGECREPAFVNDSVMGRDFCASPDSSPPYLGMFGSFIINERPWCDNGSRPPWNVFADDECHQLLGSWEPQALYNPQGPDQDGTCVSLSEPGFRGYAFVCDGFDMAWGLNGPPRDSDNDDDNQLVIASTPNEISTSTVESESLLTASTSIGTTTQVPASTTTSMSSVISTGLFVTGPQTSNETPADPTPTTSEPSSASSNKCAMGAVFSFALTIGMFFR